MTRRAPRGFTVIEAIVVATLSSAALLGAISLIVTLNSALATDLSSSQQARQLTQLDDQFTRDLAAARPCHPARVGATFADPGVDAGLAVAFAIDPELDGQVDHVVWRLTGGELTRTRVADVGCAPDLDQVRGGSPILVGATPTGDLDGDPSGIWTEPADPDVCDGPADVCPPGKVRLELEATSSDGTTLQVTRQYPVPAGAHR